MTDLSKAERIAIAMILVERGAEPGEASNLVKVVREGIARGEDDSVELASQVLAHLETVSPGFVARLEAFLDGRDKLAASEARLTSILETLRILVDTPASDDMMSSVVIRQAMETRIQS